ncbi:MAG: phosphatidylglycerol:prolipoprotein diacylglycerol transferase [Candidatus Endobugula sp.]|jgi:phosphatidylglycerol:prolipoprotein diacylglycerol transferase
MLTYPNIDPVAISVGSLKVHWYGIMYLLAFAAAWLIAWKRAALPSSPLQRTQIEDLIVYGALGVVLGGRFGYVVLYNFETWMRDPLWLFRVWEGGMAFHGGLLGVILAIFFYCRRIKIPFSASLDFIAPLVPIGLGLGRLGNFIGQELWGRATDVSWGMVFPRDPEQLVRHPSQLYQAFLEGVVLFIIVYWFSRKPRPRLAVGSVFLIFYGIFRFAIEFVRQPDDHIKTLIFGWMTRGQLLTIPMIVVGVAVLFWAYYSQKESAAVNNEASKETQK